MMQRIGDVAPAGASFDGEQINLRQLEGRNFTIKAAEKMQGDDGEYFVVSIELAGKEYFFFSSHKVVSRQLEKAQGSFPLLASVELRQGNAPGRDYFVLV